MGDNLTYKQSGVDYGAMDAFKLMAQRMGFRTSANLLGSGFLEISWSRGESCYIMGADDCYIAHVEEGLGTKNLVADAMYGLTGKSFYYNIAQDTVAMIVNDMITLGAFPLSVAMHLAVGDSNWFNDELRCRNLIEGWRDACDLSRCVWGGGETSTLKDIIAPETIVLSGSAVGIVKYKNRVIVANNIKHGDAIIFIESSGIHANGLTLARKVSGKLPEGYLASISDGRTFGEALLDPTHVYVGLMEDCINALLDIHYAINITGHGWRKLMRATQPFSYVIEHLPDPLPIFDFIQKYGPINDREAYGTFNMGAGFALYVPEQDVDTVLKIAESYNFKAWRAGHIEKGEKKVLIKPLNIEFSGDELKIR